MTSEGSWDRRSVLRGAAAVAGGAAAMPLLGGTAAARTGIEDADALFKSGRFEEAGRAYEKILKTDPGNVRAARQRGYVGLLSNRFPEAEKYLRMAFDLAPDDKDTNRLLGDCYIRQDEFARSVPHWRAAGKEVFAKWFGALRGEAYQIRGDTARLPWQQVDPTPLVEGSVNGGPPKRFMFYTGAPWLGMSAKVAEEAGLTAVAEQKIDYLDGTAWQYFGVLESFTMDGIELRNIPVEWSETDQVSPGGANDGIIGTWIFYHLLTTFDYAGRTLILRRRTPETAAKVRAAALRAGADRLPLWLAREHGVHSRGGIAGSGPGVVGLSIGGTGESAAIMSEETAERSRVRIDRDRPLETFGHSHPVVVYPCYPKELRLGGASARDIYCGANPTMRPAPDGFDTLGAFFHPFYKPFNITLDFTDMNVYVGRGKAA
ncbi:aspartyl protease family protein [Actinomadura madurae]|uniref:aspartyl protease family protein n=2 Tax=Actinomadura madurae TaxID=1993 RepID=UPI0020D20AA6|nr:aspartyl protease family protein [Actinomadura madurae]MCP9968875.1 aspartyl protease family protein [Actinomadura madurae]MCP9981356.1 aspartyl protease family protein [Actinomadura madurae]MCQ0007140.1 aspartyl protease family protein [Actinomadura madurae]MCQ0017551.1 aspartyl protease family protein [Actinomadura madurae]